MKRSRIVLFLFSVIACLAVLCAVFPEEGILGLRFPQLGEVLSAAEPSQGPSPEELIEQRRQAVLAAQRSEYQSFFREDPARFYLPDDDIRFFDELFAAFDAAETEPVRIVHYGDSQIEEDRITGTIRERLQARFGGNGPGMMPARRHATPRVGGGSTAELRRYFNYGDQSYRAGIRQYGPYADFTRLDTVSTFSFYPLSRKEKGPNTFERMTLVAGNVQSTLSVTSKGDRRTVEAGTRPLAFVRFELPDSSTRASMTVAGYADLYGILLDSRTGIRMDNIAMRGSSGAMVNGKAVPIREKLKTGDVVEIMTRKDQRPNRDWLGWVVSSKARTKIRQELDADERKAAADGRELLERRLRNWKLDFPDDWMMEFIKVRKYPSVLPFMAAIAREEVDVNDIKAFIQRKLAAQQERPAAQAAEEAEAASPKGYSGSADDILVLNAKNVKGLEYKMSKCCNPVFGDDVFGFVTRTEGIKIHRMSCPNAARLIERYPYRIQKVVWQDNPGQGDFQCTLAVTADLDHPVLSAIMDIIGQFRVSMRAFNVKENLRAGTYEITIRLLVPSSAELDKVLSQVGALKQVIKIRRI